jgi:hypothetical protein
MPTQQLFLTQTPRSSHTSGVALLFFLLGAPNIYSALRQRANQPTVRSSLRWTMGVGVMLFILAGTTVCWNGLA